MISFIANIFLVVVDTKKVKQHDLDISSLCIFYNLLILLLQKGEQQLPYTNKCLPMLNDAMSHLHGMVMVCNHILIVVSEMRFIYF